MRRSRAFIVFGAVLLFLTVLATTAQLRSQETAEGLYEAALLKKEAIGDLQGAIQLFQKILKQFPEKRDIAAKAQFQIGACYEKLGTAEAVKAYELVLKNYADQPDLVAAARERLAALKSAPPLGRFLVTLTPGTAFREVCGVSPDGTKLVGFNYDTGENIVVHDTVTNRTELVTHFDYSEGSYWTDVPVWSPDGKEIAYEQCPNKSGSRGSELRITDLAGTSRLLLSTKTEEIWPEAWLPKRGELVCVRQHADKSYDLGLVPLAGGSFRLLCPVPGGPWGTWGSCSPDERNLAYTHGKPGANDIWIVSLDGGAPQALIDHAANDDHPVWTPDGNYIVFRSDRQGGNALWGQAMKEGRAEGEPFMIEEMLPRTDLLNWTEQGLAIYRFTEISDIYVQDIDPESYDLQGKPRLIPYTSPGKNSGLRWSPDGKFAAFVSTSFDRPARVHIVVQPSEGGEAREFLAPVYVWEQSMHTLAWSPDGRRLGFATYALNSDNKQTCLMILDLDSGEWKTHPLPNFLYAATHMEWSRDGRSVFYGNLGEVTDPGVVEWNLETGEERYVYRPEKPGNFDFSSLRPSKDRQWLAFHQENREAPGPTTLRQILALKTDTGEVRKIYAGTDGVGSPVWSPDGRSLLVLCGIEPSTYTVGMARELGILPVSGGPLKKLKIDIHWPTGPGFDHGFVSTDWSPDGKRIAFTARSAKEEIYLMKYVIPASAKK